MEEKESYVHRASLNIHYSVHMFRQRLACSDLPGLLTIEGALVICQQIGSGLMPLSVHVSSADTAVNFADYVACEYIAQDQHEAQRPMLTRELLDM